MIFLSVIFIALLLSVKCEEMRVVGDEDTDENVKMISNALTHFKVGTIHTVLEGVAAYQFRSKLVLSPYWLDFSNPPY